MSQNQIKNSIKIESIKKLKRPGFYSLITNEETITIADDVIVKYCLTKDLELDKEVFEEIKKYNEKNNFFLKAIHYIYYQMRSEYEVREYLQKNYVNDQDTDEIIDKLKELKFIDDNELCKLILESTINTLKGPNNFIQKVKQRKLDVNLKDYLYDKDIEEEVIQKVIVKNVSKKETLPLKKQKEQLYSKLIRDGFSNDLINHYINKVEFTDKSDISLDKELNKLMRKHQDLDDKTKKNKIINSLIKKGYSYTQINSKINSIDNDY